MENIFADLDYERKIDDIREVLYWSNLFRLFPGIFKQKFPRVNSLLGNVFLFTFVPVLFSSVERDKYQKSTSPVSSIYDDFYTEYMTMTSCMNQTIQDRRENLLTVFCTNDITSLITCIFYFLTHFIFIKNSHTQ